MRTVLYLFFFCIAILTLLHLPYVQTKIINSFIGRITSAVNGEIVIQEAKANIYQGLTLNGVTLLDIDRDTLLNIRNARISPRNTLITLITGELAFHDLLLNGVKIKVHYDKDPHRSNWEKFAGSQNENNEKDSTALSFDVSHVRLNDVHLDWTDEGSQEIIEANFVALEVDINKLNFSDDALIDIERILLHEPFVKYSLGNSSETIVKTKDVQDPKAIEKTSNSLPVINIRNLLVVDGIFNLERKDAEAIVASDLDLSIRDLNLYERTNWSLVIDKLSGQTIYDQLPYASFGLIERRGDNVEIQNAFINLNDSKLKMSGSIKNVKGMADLSSSVFNLSLNPSILYIKDLFTFVPDLKERLEKDPIANEKIQAEGDFLIRGHSYKGNNISIWLNGLHHFEGNLSFDKSDKIAESLLNANINKLFVDVQNLSRRFPGLNIPDEIVRLNSFNFSGSFDGYLNDFVANGLLMSPLGKANMDIKFDLSGEGEEAVIYNGFLSLDSFDLKRFTLNDEFGIVEAQVNISNGKGSDIASSSANLNASIDRFEYKDFVYEKAKYEGNLSSKVIDGKFEIHDDQLDFEFEGILDFTDSLPVFDFRILAEKINFCQLNITDFPCELAFSSVINLTGNHVNNIQGSAELKNIVLRHDTSSLDIQKIEVLSLPGENANHLSIKSDYVDFDIEGRFNLLKVYQHTLNQLITNVEAHNQVWKYDLSEEEDVVEEYNYSILLKDATPIFKFAKLNIKQIGYASISGHQSTLDNDISLKASIPFLSYNEVSADRINLSISSSDGNAKLETKLHNIVRSDFSLKEIDLKANLNDEHADWSIAYDYDDYNRSSLSAVSEVKDNGYFTKFQENNVLIDSTKWEILSREGIGIYPGKIDIEEFTLSDGFRFVSLKDIANRGLEIAINDFELDFINPIIDYDKTILSGKIKSRVRIDDIYEDLALQGFVDVADFEINGDDFGHLILKAQRSTDSTNVIDLDLRIEKDTQNLYALGYLDLDSSYLNVDLNLEDYPLSFFEYIIEDGISETIGTTDIRAKVFGHLDDLSMSGQGLIKNGGVKVNYLGAFYRMEDQTVLIDEKFIDFNGVELIDEMGNTARITGGLRHNLLADIRADLFISSPRFIGLNTTDVDNPLYYGLGVGKIDISFKGPFDAIDIVVAARLDNLSKLSIPLTTTSYIYDESFIVFSNAKDTVEEKDSESLAELLKEQGVDFEMSLTFTPDAVVSIIYDETTGNILEGTGEGNLQINVKRDGAFTAYGNYNVLTGKYLYTAYGLIAKQFVIRNGGSVIWTGDPLNATLDVTAEYPQLRAPLQNFLSEYQGSPSVTDQALSIRRDVNLTLILTGPLFNPNINFDISFPDLTGNLRTYAQNKVRVLRATENGINNQVVGLLVFRDFLPDNNGLAAISQSDVGQTGTNTITQFLTSQLSLLFSDYLSSKLGDNNILSGIDFEIAVAQNSILAEDANLFEGLIDVVPDEFQLNLRNRFKNENFVLNLGGNYVRENQLSQAQNYVTGDFSLDWYITEDRRLKLKFYGNYDYDDAFSTRRQRYGFGINYRKEFGSLTYSGFQQVLEDMIKEIQQETSTSGVNK